jgi:uncharacterized protein YqgV (UPF0045/DUF77 family)
MATEARQVHVEVFVEPFKENEPGRHVTAAVDVLRHAGLDPEMGPFATTATGSLDQVLGIVRSLLEDSFDAGATAVSLRVASAER